MKNFLCPLHRLSPTASANLPTAKTAVGSDTLTRSGYARSDHENRPTVSLCVFFLSAAIYATKINRTIRMASFAPNIFIFLDTKKTV